MVNRNITVTSQRDAATQGNEDQRQHGRANGSHQ
jgi:hypothetical protein